MINFKHAQHWLGINNVNLYCIDTREDWDTMLEWLEEQPIFAADTETNGFHYYMDNRIVGMSFGWFDEHFYVPVRHTESVTGGKPGRQLDMDDLRPDLKRFFGRVNFTAVGHNFRFDQHFYRSDNIEVLCRVEDTMLKWALHDENAPAALKDICAGWKDGLGRYHKGIVGKAAREGEKEISEWRSKEAAARRKIFTQLVTKRARELACDIANQGITLPNLKKIAKEQLKDHPFYEAKKDDVNYGHVPIEIMAKYAAMDTYLTYKVYEFLQTQIKFNQPKLKALYENELELSACLLDLEENGMKCDRAYIEEKSKEYAQKIIEKRALLESTLGMINMNSSQQLLVALQNQGCVFTKKTDAGSYSTDKKVLNKLAKDHLIVKELLLYRAMMKLKNTYFDGILARLTPDDYCHTSFNQNVRTGRMSSRAPNFTNMPRGNLVRDIFICPEDYIYILADYSQIEIRITAHYSKDPLLLEAYRLGQDVHTRTMSEVFGVDYDLAVEILSNKKNPRYEEVSTLRTVCKIVNFGVIYGVSPMGLSEQIPRPAKYANASEEEWVEVCTQYVEDYFEKYQGVKRFVDKYSYLAKKQAFVETHFGRIRHLPEVNAVAILGDRQKYWMEKKAQRQGVNVMIQGSAADLFKIALVRINKMLREGNYKTRLVNTVHDEVQFYLHKDEKFLLAKIREYMEDFDFAVPIVADFSYSKTSWAQKQDLK